MLLSVKPFFLLVILNPGVFSKDHLEHCVADAHDADLQALNEAIDKFM